MTSRDASSFNGSTINIQPGFVVIDCSTAEGGVRYERRDHEVETHSDDSERAEWSTIRHVDNRTVVRELDAVVKKVDYVLRCNGSRTGFGWYCSAIGRGKIEGDILKLREEAERLNSWAASVGSARRARISVVFATLDVANEATAQEIYRIMREILTAMRDCLRVGVIDATLDKHIQKSKNMGNIAAGILRFTLDYALARVPTARQEIRTAIRQGTAPHDAGAACDLSNLDAAIELFGGES